MTPYPRSTTRRFPHRVRALRPRAGSMCQASRSVAAPAAAAMAGLMVGCAQHAARPSSADDGLPPQDPTTIWNSPHFEGVNHPTTVVAAEGPPPLFYNLKRGDRVRVVDSTTGKELASAIAAGPAIVNVQTSGVFIGEQRFHAGGIAADHMYQVLLDVAPEQSWRTGVQVAPVRPPAMTRPAEH